MKVTVLGLGLMGLPVALRLQQQGFATLGHLLAFQDQGLADIVAGQRERDWITDQPEGLRPQN